MVKIGGHGANTCTRIGKEIGRTGQPALNAHDDLLRRASIAVARNHHKALTRCLAEGLDPNAMCYAGCWHKGDTLLEAASANDALECFIALRDAGAERTVQATQNLFTPSTEQRRILSHLLVSGELSPHGAVGRGFGEITCHDWALVSSSDDTSLQVILAEQARRERSEIMLEVDSPRAPPRTRRAL